MNNEEPKRTKIKCSARFKLTTIRIMQLDGIEFYLNAEDEKDTVLIDSSLVKDYVVELWNKGEIDLCEGIGHFEEENYDDDIDEIVSFEIIKSTPTETFNPDQTTLPL